MFPQIGVAFHVNWCTHGSSILLKLVRRRRSPTRTRYGAAPQHGSSGPGGGAMEGAGSGAPGPGPHRLWGFRVLVPAMSQVSSQMHDGLKLKGIRQKHLHLYRSGFSVEVDSTGKRHGYLLWQGVAQKPGHGSRD